jgi:hypothetical protein
MTQPEERPTAQEIAASIEEAALQPDPSAFEIAVANSARLLMSTAGPALVKLTYSCLRTLD